VAGDWIKMEVTTPDKPEVHAIAEELKIDPDMVVGKLFRVWAWFDQHTDDGNAGSVSEAFIDRIAGCERFAYAMAMAGWLMPINGKYSLPNFSRHNGNTAKNRALTAKRVARHKFEKGNAQVTHTSLPREEKRREEKNKEEARSRGSRLPPDWLPSEDLTAWASEKRPDLDLDETIENFKDFWKAATGRNASKLDWDAAFRTWVRGERSRPSRPQLQPVASSSRPSIVCSKCNERAFTWTGDKCDPCWRREQRLSA
jgi:hypothetical protein